MYWFFVKTLGPIAKLIFYPESEGVKNIPKNGGAIIASNHLAVIDDAVIPMTCPRMVHFMGKSDYFTGKGFKGRIKKWFFTSVGVFPVDSSGGKKSAEAMNNARKVLEEGHLFGIHPEGTRSPDGRLYKGHTGVARLSLETGCPIIPVALIGTGELQPAGKVWPRRGKVKVIYGKPIYVSKIAANKITHEQIRSLTDRMTEEIRKMSGQTYVDEYAQTVKKRIAGEKQAQA